MGQPIPQEVDHINGDGSDNRWCNLRESNPQKNACNRRRRKTNSSGCTGVFRKHDRWFALITFHGKRKHLGTFRSLDAAIKARKDAERELGFSPEHGSNRPL